MSYEPLVSIVMPVYNGSNYMRQAINSALAQTYNNIEVIVVNDGSCDGGATRAIAESFSGRIVYVHRDENRGIAYTLNEGIAHMKGEYFAWLSHDDLYFPDKVASQIEFLNRILDTLNPPDRKKIALSGGSVTINAAGKIIRRRRMQRQSRRLRSAGEQILDNMKNHGLGGCTVLIPREAFEEVGGFDPRWVTVQDADMWHRMILGGYIFCYLQKRLVKNRAHREETGRRLQEVFERERASFQDWLLDRMMEIPQLQDWRFFTSVGCFDAKYSFAGPGRRALACAKSLAPPWKYRLLCRPRYLFYVLLGKVRAVTRKAYWKFVVRE